MRQHEQNTINNNHKNLDRNPSALEAILMSNFSRVVQAGNQKPYQFEMLFKIPWAFTFSSFKKIYQKRIRKTRKNSIWKLSPISLLKVDLSKSLYVMFLMSSCDMACLCLAVTFKPFLDWIGDEEAKSWQVGIMFVSLLTFFMGSRIYLLAKGFEHSKKIQGVFLNTVMVRSKYFHFSGLY